METDKSVRIYESLVARYPQDIIIANGAWQTYWMASNTYEGQDNIISYDYALKALKIVQTMVDADPADAQARKRLARTFSTLGQAANNTGRHDESIGYLKKAVAESTQLIETDPGSGLTKTDIAVARMRLAEALAKKKRYHDAINELEKADSIYLGLLQDEPGDDYSIRNQAISSDFKSEIHDKWAMSVSGNERRAHRDEAKRCRAETLEILMRLESLGTLAEFDRKWLEKQKMAVKRDNL